jgi:predicted nucleotidyltransferase
MLLQPAEQQALIADFKKAVSQLYGDRLAKIILYGSYARGDAHGESDIDFLVVLKDDSLRTLSEIIQMGAVVSPLILKHNVEISYHPITLNRLQTERSPLLFWVRKEGLEIE